MADYCIDLLQSDIPLFVINHTHIVLIPKVNNPLSLTNCCSIRLCNVIYKIALKALVNKFQEVLHLCIDEVQSTFVPGCLISDNIVATYEVLHSLKHQRLDRKGCLCSKLI